MGHLRVADGGRVRAGSDSFSGPPLGNALLLLKHVIVEDQESLAKPAMESGTYPLQETVDLLLSEASWELGDSLDEIEGHDPLV